MIAVWSLVFIASLGALVRGADMLLDGAKKIGLWLGLSPFVVGVVILGFGTSLPELVSSVVAQLQGAGELVAGNVAGSNIANILLIVALAAVISRTVVLKSADVLFDITWILASAALFVFVAFDAVITEGESLLLLFGFGLYAAALYALSTDTPYIPEDTIVPVVGRAELMRLGIGFGLLVVGAHFTVQSAVAVADIAGIGTGIVGLLAVAIGTSLPEFFVTVQAARSGHADIAVGNVFGSNVFNALFITGVAGMFGAMHVDAGTHLFGLGFLVLATILLAWFSHYKRIHSSVGLVFFALYGLFVLLVTYGIH